MKSLNHIPKSFNQTFVSVFLLHTGLFETRIGPWVCVYVFRSEVLARAYDLLYIFYIYYLLVTAPQWMHQGLGGGMGAGMVQHTSPHV